MLTNGAKRVDLSKIKPISTKFDGSIFIIEMIYLTSPTFNLGLLASCMF
jgi:hypothetical protein